MARYDVCGCGSMVVDRLWSVPHMAGADEKVCVSGGAAQRRVGGVMLNQLGWASVLGLRAAVFGKQADDGEGSFLREGMARLGIDAHLDLSGQASSTAEIFVDAHGQRSIYMSRGATAELGTDEIDGFAALIADAHWVSSEISQVPLAAVQRIFAIARAAGVQTVLDLDVPPSEALAELGSEAQLHAILASSDLLKASLSAVSDWLGTHDPREAARALAERYHCQVVVLTLGVRGSWISTATEEFAVPAASVDAIDTTGAGDAFLGGLLAGVRAGLDWEDAGRLASAAAAACCERIGAFPDEPAACRKRALELYGELGGGPLVLPERALSELPLVPRDAFLAHVLAELQRVASDLDGGALDAAARLIRDAEEAGARTHVAGIGKSAHVARFTAALLASTGTPALFLDAAEATHGSVGQLVPGDVLIAISNSGSTQELLGCTHAAAVLGARLIAVTGNPDSPLARDAEVTLPVRVEGEGGPLGLAPRASFLAQCLVLLALSVELQAARDFSHDDYHRRHPSGALGAKAAAATKKP